MGGEIGGSCFMILNSNSWIFPFIIMFMCCGCRLMTRWHPCLVDGLTDFPISKHHSVKVYGSMGGKLWHNELRRWVESYGPSSQFDYLAIAGKRPRRPLGMKLDGPENRAGNGDVKESHFLSEKSNLRHRWYSRLLYYCAIQTHVILVSHVSNTFSA